jgi:hypothetical protein
LLGATAAAVLGSLAAIEPSEDVELRDLKLEAWNCSMKDDGTAQSQEAKERNRMKNRWSVNLSGFAVEYVDTASFLKKVREFSPNLGLLGKQVFWPEQVSHRKRQ